MPDSGNPNFFKIFQGKGKVALNSGATSSNTGIMLTMTNELQFLGDYVVGEDGVLGVLPEGYRPKTDTFFSVGASIGELTKLTLIRVYANGTLVCETPSSTVKTSGIVVNLSGNWY